MTTVPIYMDNHSTTAVDPRVLEAMLPYFGAVFGNAGSASHVFGAEAKVAVDAARETIAAAIGASPREIVFTSGATESANLAIRGAAMRERRRGSHLVSVVTEHKAVLDPLAQLARRGFEVALLPVEQAGSPAAGRITPEQVAGAIRNDTLLVSVMWANNEIGVLQPIAEIGAVCRERGVLFHCDATQAVSTQPIDVRAANVDLLSLSAHKVYGPKGVGCLYVRRGVRLQPQIDGGGQEHGLRSGTLNVPGIVGFARALAICHDELSSEPARLAGLRDELFRRIREAVPGVELNGPALDVPGLRLPSNLNLRFGDVEGEALMLNMPGLAVSSGSACTSAEPEPSHVLRALGLNDDQVRSSLRFGLGRFNRPEELPAVVTMLAEAAERLRALR